MTKTTEWCHEAEVIVTNRLCDAMVCKGNVGDHLPAEARSWKGDHIISFVSPWIVPTSVLQRAARAAVNFHPGPPEYPGIGCYNFALYDEVKEYGVTCHHMAAKVDTGRIIEVVRFPVTADDTVGSLKNRSMDAMLALLARIVTILGEGGELPSSRETWKRRPYTRQELNELGRVTREMSDDEVRRRVRAMHYPGFPGAFIDLAGVIFRA